MCSNMLTIWFPTQCLDCRTELELKNNQEAKVDTLQQSIRREQRDTVHSSAC